MIISFLYSLGFSIILTANIGDYCGFTEGGGCYVISTKQIVINETIPTYRFRSTFYHEVGHALFWNDEKAMALSSDSKLYDTYKDRKNGKHELLADYHARYWTSPVYLQRTNEPLHDYFKQYYDRLLN